MQVSSWVVQTHILLYISFYSQLLLWYDIVWITIVWLHGMAYCKYCSNCIHMPITQWQLWHSEQPSILKNKIRGYLSAKNHNFTKCALPVMILLIRYTHIPFYFCFSFTSSTSSIHHYALWLHTITLSLASLDWSHLFDGHMIYIAQWQLWHSEQPSV